MHMLCTLGDVCAKYIFVNNRKELKSFFFFLSIKWSDCTSSIVFFSPYLQRNRRNDLIDFFYFYSKCHTAFLWCFNELYSLFSLSPYTLPIPNAYLLPFITNVWDLCKKKEKRGLTSELVSYVYSRSLWPIRTCNVYPLNFYFLFRFAGC